ncbi:MAG: hypothetical protein LW595_02195 [Rickettsiales bacterium]|jgi:hypothetical protein|nr:hypothetical protein [Rickettsiales bacterium]
MNNFLIKFFASIFLILITSCGFEVVYRDDLRQKNSQLNQANHYSFYQGELSAIKIKKTRTRIDQQLKNHLYDIFNPDYIKVKPKYFLVLTIDKKNLTTFVTETGGSGRNKIIIKVDYELRLIENQQKIASGTVNAADNYSINSNRYGTFVAEDYFSANLTKIIASNLRNSLINDLTEYHSKQKK